MVRLNRIMLPVSASFGAFSSTIAALVTMIAAQYAGNSRAKRLTAKSAALRVRSSVMKMTKPEIAKNSSTPKCPHEMPCEMVCAAGSTSTPRQVK